MMVDSTRRWFRFRIRTLLLLILIVAVGMSVYSYWTDYRRDQLRRARELPHPTAGDYCTVVLTRETVGIERMSPKPSSVNGVSNHVIGRFRAMNDEWIVLDGRQSTDPSVWVPRDKVLMLRITPQ